jgi:tRNA(Leu) C34 or U34 (ribose-2'-O)-methylase TrmL
MFESLILVLSLCIDTFVAGIAYGTDRIKIPMAGKTESLNAAVATSVILYEAYRQKISKK